MSTEDYTRRQGAAAIGARLRRISERMDREAERVYAELGVNFEQRWFGVVNQLSTRASCSVGELATLLGVTHAAVSQVRSALEERGLIAPHIDPADARRTVLSLTAAGRRLVKRLRPTWDAMNDAARELDGEARGVVVALDRLEAALDRQPLVTRVRNALNR